MIYKLDAVPRRFDPRSGKKRESASGLVFPAYLPVEHLSPVQSHDLDTIKDPVLGSGKFEDSALIAAGSDCTRRFASVDLSSDSCLSRAEFGENWGPGQQKTAPDPYAHTDFGNISGENSPKIAAGRKKPAGIAGPRQNGVKIAVADVLKRVHRFVGMIEKIPLTLRTEEARIALRTDVFEYRDRLNSILDTSALTAFHDDRTPPITSDNLKTGLSAQTIPICSIK